MLRYVYHNNNILLQKRNFNKNKNGK